MVIHLLKGGGNMPKVCRKYARQDFSDLLSELKSTSTTTFDELKQVKYISVLEINSNQNIITNEECIVDNARRRRFSKMDNPKMKYAYSTISGVLHDRDCPLVKKVRDEFFEMTENYETEMQTCKCCYTIALIRNGTDDGSKHINTYSRFFNKVGATQHDLYKLFIENNAKLKWINANTVQLKVNDDSWQIAFIDGENHLYHNNYIYLKDNTRHFDGGFHKQLVIGNKFHNFLYVMINYSWTEHLEKIKVD